MNDAILLAEYAELKKLLLPQPWHANCEIIPDYRPSHAGTDWPTIVAIRYNDGTEHTPFLRYSKGPLQGYLWDMYGDDFHRIPLAILALSRAPYPRYVGPISVVVPVGG